MKNFKLFLFLITILLYAFQILGCSQPCTCYENQIESSQTKNENGDTWKTSIINTSGIKKRLDRYGYEPIFGFHLPEINGVYYFIFLDPSKTIHGINIENLNDTFCIKLDFNTSLSKAYSVLIKKDTIHLVDNWRKKYFRYYFEAIKNIHQFDSIDISKNQVTDNLFFVTKPNYKTIEYHYPYIFIPYGKRKETNMIDQKAYLKINVDTKKIEKILNYPNCYHCSYIYDKQSTLAITSKAEITGTFNKSEELYKVSLSDSIIIKSKIFHNCNFSDFDKDKVQNLSYVRKYLENTEKNLSLFNIANEKIALLKREQKNNLTDQASYSLVLFEKSLKQISYEKLKYKIFAPASFEYRNGILILSDSLTKGYYYEATN